MKKERSDQPEEGPVYELELYTITPALPKLVKRLGKKGPLLQSLGWALDDLPLPDSLLKELEDLEAATRKAKEEVQ